MLKNKSAKKKVNKELLRRPDVYVTALSSKNELKLARSATTGEKFDTLDERIDHEVDRLNKKIDVAMLQQEDKENHTIENTVEGMTTDMLVKGRTLQNIFPSDPTKLSISSGSISDGLITINAQTNTYGNMWDVKNPLYKTNTKYSVIIDILENTLVKGENTQLNQDYLFIGKSGGQNDSVFSGARALIIGDGSKGRYVIPLETISDFSAMTNNYGARIFLSNVFTGGQLKLKIMILEGDWTNKPIPEYFEGIKSFGQQEDKISILSHGKNLLNINDFYITLKNISNNGIFEEEKDGRKCIKITQLSQFWDKGYEKIKFKEKTRYTFTGTAFHTSNNRSILTIKYNDGSYVDISIDANEWNKFNFISDGNKTIKGIFSAYTTDTFAYIDKNTFMIEEGEPPTEFEQYKSDKKDILLSEYGFDEGLRGLSSIVCDELNDIRNVAIKRIEKKIISNDDNIIFEGNLNSLYKYYLTIQNLKPSSIISDYPVATNHNDWINATKKCILVSDRISSKSNRVYIVSDLPLEEFKASLNLNPISLYYELAEPIETPLGESINVKAFRERTYIGFENSISGTSSFKVPVNTVATITRLNRENRALEEENKNLRQDFESTTLTLTDSDLELVKQNVDMDFRLMEVEFALDIPQAILSSNIKFKNKKGEVKSMARTPYEMMKIVIRSGDYDREDYIHKVGKYYERGRMTKEEHDELMSLMTADEVISK